MERLEQLKPPPPLVPVNGVADHSFPTTQRFAHGGFSYYFYIAVAMRGTKSALHKKAT